MENPPIEDSESGDAEPTDSCSETSPSHPGAEVPSGTTIVEDPYQDVSHFLEVF